MKKNNDANQVTIRLWPPDKTLLKRTTGHVSLETFKGNFEPNLSKKKKNESGIYMSFWPGGCRKKNVCEEKTAHFHTYHQDLLIEETPPIPPKGITLFGLNIDKINDECINFIKSNPDWDLSGSSFLTWLLSFFTKKTVSNCSGICGQLLDKGGIQTHLTEYYSEGSLAGSLGMMPMIIFGMIYVLISDTIMAMIHQKSPNTINIIGVTGLLTTSAFIGANFSAIKNSSLKNIIKTNFQNIKRGTIGSFLGGITAFTLWWYLIIKKFDDGDGIPHILFTGLGATGGSIAAVGVSKNLAPGILIGSISTTLGFSLGAVIILISKSFANFPVNFNIKMPTMISVGLSVGLISAMISSQLVSAAIKHGILTPQGIQRYAKFVEELQIQKNLVAEKKLLLRESNPNTSQNSFFHNHYKKLVKGGIATITLAGASFLIWKKKVVINNALISARHIFSMK